MLIKNGDRCMTKISDASHFVVNNIFPVENIVSIINLFKCDSKDECLKTIERLVENKCSILNSRIPEALNKNLLHLACERHEDEFREVIIKLITVAPTLVTQLDMRAQTPLSYYQTRNLYNLQCDPAVVNALTKAVQPTVHENLIGIDNINKKFSALISISHIASGVLSGQQFVKAFSNDMKMTLINAAWLSLELNKSLSIGATYKIFKSNPKFYTGIRFGVYALTALNILNGYVGEVKPEDKGYFAKFSVSAWNYSYKGILIFSIFHKIMLRNPIEIAACLGSVAVTCLDKNKKLPLRVSEFWEQISRSWFVWAISIPSKIL